MSTGFLVPDRIFEQQFSQIYFLRLALLKPKILKTISTCWIESKTERILDLSGDGARTVLIGTVYVDLPLKPNVMDDLARSLQISDSLFLNVGYRGEGDFKGKIMLEDESGRIELVFPGRSLPFGIITGMVIAVIGNQSDGGFLVDDLCLPGQSLGIVDVKNHPLKDNRICLVSGLDMEIYHEAFTIPYQLLFSFLESEKEGALILAGNSLSTNLLSSQSGLYSSIRCLDERLSRLTMDIFCIPGANDPTSFALPQRPFPRGFFKKTDKITLCPNPVMLNVFGLKILVISGQNVDDMMNYFVVEKSNPDKSRFELAAMTLTALHIAPTAPDTLYRDPFVIDQLPDIYVISNQPCFMSGTTQVLDKMVRIVLLPRFSAIPTACIVDAEGIKFVSFGQDIKQN